MDELFIVLDNIVRACYKLFFKLHRNSLLTLFMWWIQFWANLSSIPSYRHTFWMTFLWLKFVVKHASSCCWYHCSNGHYGIYESDVGVSYDDYVGIPAWLQVSKKMILAWWILNHYHFLCLLKEQGRTSLVVFCTNLI